MEKKVLSVRTLTHRSLVLLLCLRSLALVDLAVACRRYLASGHVVPADL